MTKKHVGEIRISHRILKIGYQDYPLANISRVQMIEVTYAGRLAKWRPIVRIVTLIVLGAALVAGASVVRQKNLDSNAHLASNARTAALVVAGIVGALVVWQLAVLIYRLAFRKTPYALILETSGTQYAALSGTDRDQVLWVKNAIVDAIENPPWQEQVIHVGGDLVVGDKIGGHSFRGNVGTSGAGSPLTIS